MHVLLTAALLAASPAPVKIAAPGLDAIQLDQKKTDFFLEYLAQELGQHGCQVVTSKEIGAVIGLERQKQLLGCADGAQSCLAELAGALGAEAVLVGSIASLEGEYTFTLRIVSSKDATTLAQRTGRVSGDRAALDWLSAAAKGLADETRRTLRPAAETAPIAAPDSTVRTGAAAPRSGTLRRLSWIPAGVGLACVGTGAWFMSSAAQKQTALTSSGLGSASAAHTAATDGANAQNVARALFVAGGVAAAAAVGMFVAGGSEDDPGSASVGAIITPGGAALSYAGAF